MLVLLHTLHSLVLVAPIRHLSLSPVCWCFYPGYTLQRLLHFTVSLSLSRLLSGSIIHSHFHFSLFLFVFYLDFGNGTRKRQQFGVLLFVYSANCDTAVAITNLYAPSYFGTPCERASVYVLARCSCHMMRVLVNAECVCVCAYV